MQQAMFNSMKTIDRSLKLDTHFYPKNNLSSHFPLRDDMLIRVTKRPSIFVRVTFVFAVGFNSIFIGTDFIDSC